MLQESKILTQEYILSELEFTLSNDVELSKTDPDTIVIKHVPTKNYMLVTTEQVWLLKKFRNPTNLKKLIPYLISERKCPPLRELYELCLKALKAGILESPEVEPNLPTAIASEWNLKLHFKMANFFAILSILFGTFSFFFVDLTIPVHLFDVIIGYVAICISVSTGYFLSACLLRGFDHEVYDVGLNWKHLFPHFYIDISDAQMGGKHSESTVALIQMAPLFLVVGAIGYWMPGLMSILVLGIFQATQPHRNSSGWIFLESLFRKKTLSTDQEPDFYEELTLKEKLSRKYKYLDKKFFLISTIYTLIWTATFVYTLLSILDFPLDSLFTTYIAEGYHRNFFIFIATVITLFGLYVIIELSRTSGIKLKKPRTQVQELRVKSKKDPGLTQEQVVDFLKHCLLFQDLDNEGLEAIADHMDIRFFKKKQIIYNEGEEDAELHIVARGKVESLMKLKSGRPVRITTLGVGDIFGERAVTFDVPHTRTIRTTTQTECLVLSAEHFTELVVNKLGFKKVRMIIEKHYFMFRTPLCQEWSKETMHQFARLATFANYKPNETILSKGFSNKFFYIVYDGILEVQQNGKTVANLVAGEFFGEISLLQNSVCVADVVAQTESRCLIISRADFLSLVGKDYHFGLQFEYISSKRLKHPIFPLKGIAYSGAEIRG